MDLLANCLTATPGKLTAPWGGTTPAGDYGSVQVVHFILGKIVQIIWGFPLYGSEISVLTHCRDWRRF
jgi:hypothetical protein